MVPNSVHIDQQCWTRDSSVGTVLWRGVSSCSPGCVIHYHQHKDHWAAQETDGSLLTNKTFLLTDIDLSLCSSSCWVFPHNEQKELGREERQLLLPSSGEQDPSPTFSLLKTSTTTTTTTTSMIPSSTSRYRWDPSTSGRVVASNDLQIVPCHYWSQQDQNYHNAVPG